MKNSLIDPKKNSKSAIPSNSVAQISRTFGLPLSGLRIPRAAERSTDVGPEEIVLSPMVWRMLMALEVMGELNSIEVSVAIDIGHLNKGEDVVGKRTIEQLLELPSERRSLEFLSNHLALERSAIWDCNLSESQRVFSPDPFEFFLAASGKTEFLNVRLQVMFSFRIVGDKLAETVGEPTKDDDAFVLMRERYEAEKKKGLDQLAAIDAKNKEISRPP
ncbi:unnamed protein product [Cochlearia groenlandica]